MEGTGKTPPNTSPEGDEERNRGPNSSGWK